MSGGQQAENTLHENAIGWTILAVVIAVIIWVFWYYNAHEVRNVVRWIRFGEAWVISWFVELGNMVGIFGEDGYHVKFLGQKVAFNFGFHGVETPKKQSDYTGMAGLHKSQLNFYYLSLFNAMTMQPLKYVFAFICGLGTFWCIFKGPRTHYRTRMGLDGFIARQSQNFPVIAPFADFNPATQPPRPPGAPVPSELPCFAEALGPEEWLAYNNIPVPDGEIDESVATKCFQKQLIGRWKGALALKPYMQVLLAAFCLKASRKRAEGDDMIGRLALCWTHKGGLNLRKDKTLLKDARKVLKNKDLSSATLSKCNQHAFITTAMLRALNTAREEGGVLAPAHFVWLRGHDRILWYPLNNLGRQSFHMEALGAIAHYKAEKLTQRPIPVPKVGFAVDTIKEYMATNKARPIPQLDYSGSKKRGVKKAI